MYRLTVGSFTTGPINIVDCKRQIVANLPNGNKGDKANAVILAARASGEAHIPEFPHISVAKVGA